MLISPRNTLSSCGSSSRLVRRTNRPARVRRGSSFILKIGPEASLCSISADNSWSAPRRIERNFQHVNSRPPAPTRVCRKNAPPGESIMM
jgi:hypothetical protein